MAAPTWLGGKLGEMRRAANGRGLIVEGPRANWIIPPVAALVATNYQGKDRVKAYAIIAAVSGAAELLHVGGFMMTTLPRYVFFAEVFIMAGVLSFTKHIADKPRPKKVPNFFLRAPTLGWRPDTCSIRHVRVQRAGLSREPNSDSRAQRRPVGVSLVAYLILAGIIVLRSFYLREQRLEAEGKNPRFLLVLKIPALRSGLGVLLAQYLVIGPLLLMPVDFTDDSRA